LFLALDPCDEDRASLGAWRDRVIAGREDLRPTDAATLHLTLAFLGERPEGEIPAIAAAAFGALQSERAPVLEPRALVGVPARRPRLFALDLADPGGRAGAIQSAVSGALAAEGLLAPERREWWPHVTLARVKGERRVEPPEAPADALPAPLRADAVTLYRSTLRPQGALYEALERRRLQSSEEYG
jgi:2'-5' RNA ligase